MSAIKIKPRGNSFQVESWANGKRLRAGFATDAEASRFAATLRDYEERGWEPIAAWDAARKSMLGVVELRLATGAQAAWKEDYRRRMWEGAKKRVKATGQPFTISVEDIVVPDRCPVLGIELRPHTPGDGRTDASPSLDRIVAELGYVPGNIAVISWRANRIKGPFSADELARVAAWFGYFEDVPPLRNVSRTPLGKKRVEKE